jgi:hypothetical protein
MPYPPSACAIFITGMLLLHTNPVISAFPSCLPRPQETHGFAKTIAPYQGRAPRTKKRASGLRNRPTPLI